MLGGKKVKKTNVKITIFERKTIRKEQEKVKKLKEKKGITLVALIVTVIVLLILAGVSIAALTGDNGILTRATDTKIETAVATVKENLQLEQIEKAIDEEEVTPETLLAEGRVKRTVQQAEDENYYMYYALKEDVVEGMQGMGKGNVASLRDVFLIDDELNVKYIASNGKEYGDELEEKILEDETKIRFASKAFSEYVSKISGATEEDMKFAWMKNQTSLTIDDPTIDNLEDLVFFPNLEKLILRNLTLDNLDGIENCTKLRVFQKIWSTNIKDYSKLAYLNNLAEVHLNQGKTEDFNNVINSLEKCSNLTYLDIEDCPWIKDITPIEKLKNITKLRINKVAISDLSGIDELTNLTSLTLQSNTNLISINGIEKLINLENLEISTNKVENIENISKIEKLKTLSLRNNNISDITPLSDNTELTSLDLRGNINIDEDRNNYTGERLVKLNKIGEILDRGGTIYLDIDKLKLFTNYKILDLSNQNLTTLESLEGITELTSLNLSSNKLTLEDEKSRNILASMKKLEVLYVNGNQITNLSCINDLKNLKRLSANGNNTFKMKDIENLIPNLLQLTISQTTLNTINECKVENITKLYIYYSNITQLPDLSKFTELKLLDIRGNQIENPEEIEKITSLTYLDMGNRDLHGKMINFSKLTNLIRLNLNNSLLWSEDLENLKMLKNNSNLTINLSNNSIIDATALLELNSNTKIILTGNINLSQDTKNKLKARFGNNVTF